MGFNITAYSDRARRTAHPPVKNRVGGLRGFWHSRARKTRSQPVGTHRERTATPAETVSGVHYYGYRFYNPEMGRWVSRDPIEEEGGIALYVSCSNNPTGRIDGLGEDWLDCTAECIEAEDPINAVWSKVVQSVLAGSINKSWAAKLAELCGDAELAKKIRKAKVIGGDYTSLLSTLAEKLNSVPAKRGVRMFGRAANAFWLAYGAYLAVIEAQCGSCCCVSGAAHYVDTPGIPMNPIEWATDQAVRLFYGNPEETPEGTPPEEALHETF